MVDINLVFLIQVYKVIFKVLPASVILISLALIKLFHKTAAEYLRDLIPKLVVFTWGMKMPPLETLRVIWEFMSLISLNRSSSSIGRFLFLKSNRSLSSSTQIISSNCKSLLSKMSGIQRILRRSWMGRRSFIKMCEFQQSCELLLYLL